MINDTGILAHLKNERLAIKMNNEKWRKWNLHLYSETNQHSTKIF